MAIELIELGATELIELGAFYKHVLSAVEQIESPSPVVSLFRIVEFIEDPFAGIEVEPGESISAKQKAIAQRLRTISRMTRKSLIKEASLGDLSYSSLMSESMRLAAILNMMGDEAISLGKFKIGNKLKKISKKIGRVVKSPAFLSVAGLAANLIPGAGQVASAALLGAAGVMARKKQAEAQAKGKKVKAEDLIIGSVAPALAMSQAAAAFGIGSKEGADALYSSMPKPIQDEAQKLVPGVANQIQAVGQENFLATALKALGQSGAISELFRGTGASLGPLQDILDKIAGGGGKAVEAGEQDIKNIAAAVGSERVVDEALSRGSPSKFPWPWVGVGLAGAGAIGTIVYFMGRR